MKAFYLVSTLIMFSFSSFSAPNPAATFCVNMGGDYQVRTDSAGNQAGVCVFNQNGQLSECGGWAFFRGECLIGECLLWSVDNNMCQNWAD